MAITVTRKALVNMANVKETVLSVTGKKQTFVDTYQTLNVNSVAASYVLIVGGPQKKSLSPDVVQQKALKYVKDVSCVSDLSFVPNITNVPVVAPESRSTYRGPIAPLLGNMGSPGGQSKGYNSLQRRLHTLPPDPAKF